MSLLEEYGVGSVKLVTSRGTDTMTIEVRALCLIDEAELMWKRTRAQPHRHFCCHSETKR
jgi:hypothetical protein